MNNTEDEITEDEIRIETSLDMNWVASLKEKVTETKLCDRDTEPTIYRVPDILKSVDPQAYEPLLVSLGPYHRDKPGLQAMNQLKWKCLKYLLQMNQSMVLEDYVNKIKQLETQARAAYSEEVEMDSNSFVEMMLLDGCFLMLTIMKRTAMMNSEESTWMESASSLTPYVVARDLFMLENQLPFFLLETLYKSAFPPDHPPFRELTFKFIRMFFSKQLQLSSDNIETCHHIIHLLHSCIDPTTNHGNGNGNGNQSSTFGFLCKFLCKSISKLLKRVSLPSNLSSSLLSLVNKKRTVRDANPEEDEDLHGNIGIGNGNQSSTFGFLCNSISKLLKPVFVSLPSKLSSSLSSLVIKKIIRTGRVANPLEDFNDSPWIPSATVCNEAGIHFVRKKGGKSFLDITFQFHNGKLEIPQLLIEDDTNSLLRNLIAYEQCSKDSKFLVTSYVVLMDCLIDTAADVELLRQPEILINNLGDTQQIATLFNKIGTNVFIDRDGSYLLSVYAAMRKHRDTRCNKWRARLNRDYFSNPWAAVSLFGALALFVLTVIGTTFTILSYFQSSN